MLLSNVGKIGHIGFLCEQRGCHMPLMSKAKEAGIVGPADLALLGRVFDATHMGGEGEAERQARASRILSYFLAGITDEDELRELARHALGR